MRRRAVFGAAVALASFVAAAAPAQAVQMATIRVFDNTLKVQVIDCAPTVAPGTTCRWFSLHAVDYYELSGTTTKEFTGTGGLATKQNNGTFVVDEQSATSDFTGTGTLRGTNLGRTVKLTMSMTLHCAGCAVSGTFTFTLTAKPTASSYQSYMLVSETSRTSPGCRFRVTGYANAEVDGLTGTGKVTANGVKKSIRVFAQAGFDNKMSTSNILFKHPAACPVPT